MHLFKKEQKKNFDWSSFDDLLEQVETAEHNEKVEEFRHNAMTLGLLLSGLTLMTIPGVFPKIVGAVITIASLPFHELKRKDNMLEPDEKDSDGIEKWDNYTDEVAIPSPLDTIHAVKQEIVQAMKAKEKTPPATLVHKVRDLTA